MGTIRAVFIAAWRRFVNIFRAHHVVNVKWLWNPIRVGGSQAQNPVPYYPGGNYVDWIGLDAYPEKKVAYAAAARHYQRGGSSNFDWYNTFSGYGKPLMFGEVGILPASCLRERGPDPGDLVGRCPERARAQPHPGQAIEYFDSDTAFDWRYDCARESPWRQRRGGAGGSQGVTRSCYLDVLSRACRHPAPHPSPATSQAAARPSSAIARPRLPSPSSSPPLSSPAGGSSPLGVAAIAGVVALAVVGAVLAYRRFSRR